MRAQPLPFIFIAAVAGAIWFASTREETLTQLVPLRAEKAAPASTTVSHNTPQIAWRDDFEAAMKAAKAQNKPVMIDFYTEWCGVCKMMDNQTYTAPEVAAESQKWIAIKVDAEKRPDLAGAYGVTGYPTIVWARPGGEPISILPGFAPPDEFTQMMQTARTKWGG